MWASFTNQDKIFTINVIIIIIIIIINNNNNTTNNNNTNNNNNNIHEKLLISDWLKHNRKCSKPMISYKMMKKLLCGNFEKSFSYEQKWLQERFCSTTSKQFFFHVYVYVIKK